MSDENESLGGDGNYDDVDNISEELNEDREQNGSQSESESVGSGETSVIMDNENESKKVPDGKNGGEDKRTTPRFLIKYEKARVIGTRAL